MGSIPWRLVVILRYARCCTYKHRGPFPYMERIANTSIIGNKFVITFSLRIYFLYVF